MGRPVMGGRGSSGGIQPASSPQDKARTAYGRIAATPGQWVSLADLWEQMPELSKPEFDALVTSLLHQPDVQIEEETNQKTLTERDRRAGVVIGNRRQDVIAISDEFAPTPITRTPRPPRPFNRIDAAATVAAVEGAATRADAEHRLTGLSPDQLAMVGDLIGLSPANSTVTTIIDRAAPQHTPPPTPTEQPPPKADPP
jgi:hypothetical protein